MAMRVLTGRAAWPDESGGALAGWRELVERCPWGTAFQGPEIVQAWYEAFEDRYDAVVLYERGADGTLDGLLPLARDRQTDELVPAGFEQSPVHGWLARPLRGSYFIERALGQVQADFPGRNLIFDALPPDAPTDWMRRGRSFGRWTRVERGRDWRSRFDPARAKKKLDKRANSNQLAGLRRVGDLRFEPALDGAALREVLPTLGAWYDHRAQDGGEPVRFAPSPQEIVFWGSLPERSPDFMASALFAKDVLTSAVLSVRVRDRLYVAWGADNPELEGHAPSQVLWLMLEEHLLKSGLQDADVSCGFDWMRLGAVDRHDNYRVNVYLDRAARYLDDAGRAVVDLSRWALRLIDR